MKISEFVLRTLNNRSNNFEKIKVSSVSKKDAELILKETGIDIYNYTHIVDSFGVRHVMLNHSCISKEKNKGQVAVTVDDFDLIADIVKSFDSVKYGGKNKAGRDILVYVKKTSNYFFYVEEIRSIKNKEAVIQTMYIKTKKGSND